MSESVLFAERSASSGKVAHITLNSEASLNALTLEMVDLLQARLNAWRDDDDIAAIFIDGTGERAFCAGGDVQALRASAVQIPGQAGAYAEAFFEREYRMNFTLHTYLKPVICWGHGVVMGGGLGILAGCAHRVVTGSTRIAMPEITIGLFPDVGGSWFLNHMPGSAGRFLALTGASINAADAIFTGLADRFIGHQDKPSVLARLLDTQWSSQPANNHARVREVLREFALRSAQEIPDAQVEPHLARIGELCDGDDIHAIIDNIVRQETDDRWLARARDALAQGSKFAACWIDRQLHNTRHSSLRECFQAELVLAVNAVRNPEFAEGVRALLVDKDRKPAWQYKSSRDVTHDALDDVFVAPWPVNPLADLGQG